MILQQVNDEEITTNNNTMQAFVVVLCASLFFFFEFVQLNLFNALGQDIMLALRLNASELGNLGFSYFVGDMVMLLPAGMILDRYSTRKLILGSMSLCIFATLCFALSQTFWQAALSRFVVGAASAFVLLSCVRLASRWFPPQRMALAVGLIVTIAMLGGTASQGLSWLDQLYGWRNALLIDAIVGVFLLGIIYWSVQDCPLGYVQTVRREHLALQRMGWVTAFVRSLANPQNWLGGLYTCLMNLPIFLLGGMWGDLYLQQIRHMSFNEASIISSMIFLGTIFGSPLLGLLSDNIGKRKLPMFWGALLAFVIVLILMYGVDLSRAQLMGLFFLLGLAISSQVITYPLISESNPLALTGTAESIAAVIIMAGGISQPIFGRLMEWHWDKQVVNNIQIFSVSDFRAAFFIMPIAFFISLIIVCFIKETRCRAMAKDLLVT